MAKNKRWGAKYKDKRNWKEYNEHLIKRGEFYMDPTFLETWHIELATINDRKVGQPYKYPNSLIEHLAVLKGKGFDYRALHGILRVMSRLFGPFPVISYSQIRRRILALPVSFSQSSSSRTMAVDGSGMKVTNRGEWMRQKWGVRRGWIKAVILGDDEGNIRDIRIGNDTFDERSAGRGMIRKNHKDMDKMLMDGLHDVNDTFDLCEQLNIETGINIRKNASPKGLNRRAREVRLYQKLGYRDWATHKGYGMRWPASEGIFSAVKRIFGECVASHRTRNMYRETLLKFWAYQKLRELEM